MECLWLVEVGKVSTETRGATGLWYESMLRPWPR